MDRCRALLVQFLDRRFGRANCVLLWQTDRKENNSVVSFSAVV